nr:immunoglobulin heavy chain junction region [Mus musculus]NSM07653.1 immunoglobulin heavy chain junction region [Mus musculus]NSM07899.1 immunoglobulin heavy chain junction region [Mus musculus]
CARSGSSGFYFAMDYW